MRTANRVTAGRAPHPFRQGDITFEEFLDLVPDGQKADLIDGVIYMASPDNAEAGTLNSWLGSLIHNFVDYYDLGKVYFLRVCYRIGAKRGPEPDIGFVAKELEHLRRRGYIDGPPSLAIEIVSPDSVERDYLQKRSIYEQAGVQEYWIIDPDEQRVTFLVLKGKKYQQVKPTKHIYQSRVLPGLCIDERWLLSKSRPRVYDVLRQLFEKIDKARA